jgi:nucleoid-associated protein YgaU
MPTPKPPVVSERRQVGSLRPYTVQEGDSLWRIAELELGAGQHYTKIRDLNQDVLRGGDTVMAGMILKLPAKQLATAQ